MARIYYHATFSDKPPHEQPKPSFHVGSARAAFHRVSDLADSWDYPEGSKGAVFHKYEISDSAPIGEEVKDGFGLHDPDGEFSGPTQMFDESKRLRKIQPYVNEVEDRGSYSYLIPNHFVKKGMVKHLGAQFVDMETIINTRPRHFVLE